MVEVIAAVVIFGLVFFAMSLGVIFGNRHLKGSCGGLNNLKKLLGILLVKDVQRPLQIVHYGN